MTTFITAFPVVPGTKRLAVKDLIDIVGVPTSSGSAVIAASARAARADAACLAGARREEAAGELCIVGKTNLHELAFGVTGINPWFGTPVNPIDSRLVPGGSSSGSAVALGSGEADLALGTDTGGSVRIPAACCGVLGLKTTRDRVPLQGIEPLAPSLDTVGPMARDVAGLVAGMSLLDPGFRPAEPAATVGRVRLPAEERIDRAIDAALLLSGMEVVETPLPGWQEATAAAMTILAFQAWQVHGRLCRLHGDELSQDVAERLRRAASLRAADVAAARRSAHGWEQELSGVWARVDLLALPTLAAAPPTLEDPWRLSEQRYVAPFNLAGVPALSMPVATPAGHPASLQLAGPPGGEERLVATAALVEAAAGWRGLA